MMIQRRTSALCRELSAHHVLTFDSGCNAGELLVADILSELGGQQAAPPDPSAWRRLLDSDLPLATDPAALSATTTAATPPKAPTATLKATLEQRMIEPLAALSQSDPLGRSPEPAGCATIASLEATASYSAILFGPPGTAKSIATRPRTLVFHVLI
jgi:hypothetical protein